MAKSPKLARSHLTESLCIALCRYKRDNPALSQRALVKWLEEIHQVTVTQAIISNTLQRSVELLAWEEIVNGNTKTRRPVMYQDVDEALVQRVVAYQANINISGDMIRQKVAQFLERLHPDMPKFEFSSGWLAKFKQRHQIRSHRRFGKSGAANMEIIEESLPHIRIILDQYALADIYNMDETRLFYRMQADNSFATRQLKGPKQNKERITITICSNADGSNKLPLWIIGKSFCPRCFKNINIDNLDCKYHANKNAWMTQNIFKLWLTAFDRRMDGRKVILFLDNYSAHIKDDDLEKFNIQLKNITLLYLPPNTTSKIQLCDTGIIRTFKAYYRCRFNNQLLSRIESNVADSEKINLLDGIQNAIAAWKQDV